MSEKELVSNECRNPTIKLSTLVKQVLDLKVMAMYPKEYHCREYLYNRLTKLESDLVALKDVNIELERDWWE